MEYDVISHASKVSGLGDTICAIERQIGKKAFADCYRNGPEHYKALLDLPGESPPGFPDSDRQALRVYLSAQDYIESKRQLAINLLSSPEFVTLMTTNLSAATVIRAVGLNQPLPADRILQPLVADDTKQFHDYEMEFNYLDDSELQNLSWDEFHRWYSAATYIHGQIVTRCLISPVPLPPALPKILGEVRMCYAFGQETAIYALCRSLIETALTDVCLRIGVITKQQIEADYFFKDFPPHRRVNSTLHGPDRSEAFALYTATSRVIHGAKTPDDTTNIVRRSIALVERLYSRHALRLAGTRNV